MHPFGKKARFSETGNAKSGKKVIYGALKNVQVAQNQGHGEM